MRVLACCFAVSAVGVGCRGVLSAATGTDALDGTSPLNPLQQLRWSTRDNALHLNDEPVVLHGLGSTCTEYLARGVGTDCFCGYDWADPAAVIAETNLTEVDALVGYLKPVGNQPGFRGAVRIPMTASSWLNITTAASAANMGKYPDLGGQYRTLIHNLVSNYTSNGIVTILDLHWNDDDSEQQPMALKKRTDGGNTGNALDFWDSVASAFGENKLVFYELYNEPHTDVATWMNGSDQFAGMLEMRAVVRKHTPDSMLVIAGAQAYAYDADSLLQIETQLNKAGEQNVMYNFHPYMGPNQAGASNKCQDGFEAILKQVRAGADKPFIITEFGQTCCATNGACESCPATYDGKAMGYDEAILTISAKYNVSWLPWSWRPGAVGNSGSQCMDLNGGDSPAGLSLAGPNGGNGADFATLWTKFAGHGSPTPAPAVSPAPSAPAPKTPAPGTCRACGYNCHGSCTSCGHCNTKPGCDTEAACMGSCNAGGNAMWCGGNSPSPSTHPSPAPSGQCTGGSMMACMDSCPSNPTSAFEQCVDACAENCSPKV